MTFSAVFFDLDGTLIDSLPDLADSTNRVLAKKGFPAQPLASYKYHVGDGVFNLFRRALPKEALDEKLVNECVELFNLDYNQNWHVKTRLFDGISVMLDCAASKGLKMAVLSNKPDEFTRQIVKHFLTPWPIACALGATKAFPHKPDPASSLHICQLLNVSPSSVLYVGDTGTDMKTAVNAGFYPLGALWGYRTREELVKSGAKSLAERPGDVINYLGK